MVRTQMKNEVRLDPWGTTLIEDYEKVIAKFGMSRFDKKILAKLPKPNKLMRRGVVFGHRDLEKIVDARKNKKPFICLTGIMPTAEMLHLGTKLVVEMVKYFQDTGAETYLLAADLEAMATRGVPLEEAQRRVYEFYLPAYIALGINPKKLHFYFQSKKDLVINLAFEFSPKVTASEFKAIYGEASAPKIMSSLVQVADILHPQLEIGPAPSVIPVGADQDPHIRLSRDVAARIKKYNFIPPGATYHKFTPALDGSLKMSKSKPGSFISIPEDPEVAAKKMFTTLTGGQKTVAEQRKFGGEPERCIVFELFKQHLVEDDKELTMIYRTCKGGQRLCGECKQLAAERMKKFMSDFIKKFEKAKKQVDKFR